jgi:hypothetical protein
MSDFAELAARVVRLERENRRLKFFGTAALAAAAAALAWQARTADTVRAREFVLLDPDGRTAATLVHTASGPALTLLDPAGNARAALLGKEEESGLIVYDDGGRQRAVAGYAVAQGYVFRLLNGRGGLFGQLIADGSGGGARLECYDRWENRSVVTAGGMDIWTANPAHRLTVSPYLPGLRFLSGTKEWSAPLLDAAGQPAPKEP